MDVKDYCNTMAAELTAWKAKLFDVLAETDRIGSQEQEKVWACFNEMKVIVREMEDKIEYLRTECPSEWSPHKKAIDEAHAGMKSKYREVLDHLAKAPSAHSFP